MGRNREKSNIDIAIILNIIIKDNKKISHFDGSNNIFTDFKAHTNIALCLQ